MCEKWKEKYAIVTGASSGIGAGVMKVLVRKGINVIGLARRATKIIEISEEIGETDGKIFAHECDISDMKSICSTAKWIEETFGHVNILINNAGVNFNVRILDECDETTEKLNKTVDTNFTGLVHLTRAIVRLMKKSNDYSVIINVCSTAGHTIPFIDHSWNVYPSTKYATTAFSEVLRQELTFQNLDRIRVTNLSPGGTRTDIASAGGFLNGSSGSSLDFMPKLSPEDVAGGILYVLETSFNVNVTQLTIKPVGECA